MATLHSAPAVTDSPAAASPVLNPSASSLFASGLPPPAVLAGHTPVDCPLSALAGSWRELKALSDDRSEMYAALGLSFIKRRVLAGYVTQVEIGVKGDTVHMRAFFPLGIEKESQFAADGSTENCQPDADTCDWRCVAAFCDGFLVQRRTGRLGLMYDTRGLVRRGDSGQTLLLFYWVLEPAGRSGSRIAKAIWMERIDGEGEKPTTPTTEEKSSG